MSANLVLAITAGILVACGVYLLLERSLTRILLGVILASNGVNLLFLVASGSPGAPPISGLFDENTTADPLPQAMVLTAIVITMAVTAFMLTLAALGTNDDTKRDKKHDGATEDGAVGNDVVALTSDNVTSDGDAKKGEEV